MRPILVTLALLVSFTVSPAQAQQKFENLDRLDSLVQMTMGANLGQPGGPAAPVDRRLKLAACPQTPSVEGPVFGAAVVKCEPVGWRIRVPLVAGASAAAATPLAAAKPATREMVVKKGDPVQLTAGGRAFTVTKLMVAEEDGALGQMIRVRGEDKKATPVLAQVVDMGQVRIPAFKEY